MDWQALWDSLINFAVTAGGKLIGALLVLIIGRLILRGFMKMFQRSKFAQKADPTVYRFLENFLNISLNIVLVVSIIAVLGVPMASVVAAIASAGVAIGLALQGALSNLAGGLMILLFKPFKLGNLVDTGSGSGTVTDIGIFYTVLKTADNKEITIPNGTIMSSAITNYSVHDTRRLDFTFSVAYGTDIARVKALLLEEAQKNSLVLKDPAPFARLSAQNESSLDFVLRVWVASDNYWTVHFDLLEAINDCFVSENIEVPFNQLDVHLTNPS